MGKIYGAEVLDTRQLSPDVRVHWVYDDDYQTVGNFWLDTDKETRAAENDEIKQIDDGRLMPLAYIAERRVTRGGIMLPLSESWEEFDALWGIVVSGTDDPYCRDLESQLLPESTLPAYA